MFPKETLTHNSLEHPVGLQWKDYVTFTFVTVVLFIGIIVVVVVFPHMQYSFV